MDIQTIHERERELFRVGTALISKYQMEVDPETINLETRTFCVLTQDGSDDSITTFCFPDYSQNGYSYMQLDEYTEPEFAVEMIRFVKSVSYLFEYANMLQRAEFKSCIEITNHILADLTIFLQSYVSAGFPVWNNVEHLITLVREANHYIASKQGYVYLVRAVTPHNHYKIGLSKEPIKRLESLGVKLPFPIDVLHIITAFDRFLAEKALHDYFASQRVNGEWFSLSDNDVQKICGIQHIGFRGLQL